ncbi:integrin alpha N-terminal domain-containing protein [Cristinia sonorae]|uniref:Integrin alpha N-terminal domain-containing protein n=1 Tax=Cristinia sonorae TaxID=1940300 RepID=A0A8K0USK7_9AGAR|nr:integrin alpha N-terminal domain-containing protein [Cristinia sonorae]
MHRRTTTLASLLVSLSWLTLPSQTHAIWPFPPKRFSGNSLLEAGSRGIDTDGRVVAFGDFNGDQFMDALALEADQQTFVVYLWDHEAYTFTKSGSFYHPSKVVNVVPGDFTQDGKLDLLVVTEESSSRELGLQLYVGLPDGGFDPNFLTTSASAHSQPIPMDMNGDLKIDLFGATPSSSSTFKVWQNVWNVSQPTGPVFDVVYPKMSGTQCKIADPHSNAAIDLNGDCLADIFLVCDDVNGIDKYFQIWINHKDDGYALAQSTKFPRGLQSVTFSDVDRDGTLDMLFVTCDSVSNASGAGSGCSVNIAYNKQLPLCASTTTQPVKNGKPLCRIPTDLCTADPDFSFNLRESSENPEFVRIPISDIFTSSGSTPRLLVFDTTHNPPIPLPIRLGDVNQDGFPDLLAILASGNDHTPQMAYSVSCGKGVAGCNAGGNGRRGFQMLKKGGEILRDITDARSVAFIDMDEDGTLDVMVQRTGSQGQGKVTFVQNNFYYDAFFLKAIVLNGACGSGVCVVPNSSTKYHPFGVSYSGATYKYTVLDTSGRRSAAQVGQLPQTAYHSLLTPYAYFGLGRTNNYIENLFVGSTKHTEQHFINMEGVIPNSKLVIIPPLGGNDDEASWRKELYLRPGEWIPWVTVTVVAATALLAIIVFVLHLSEKREDELERRRASHHINFDAL